MAYTIDGQRSAIRQQVGAGRAVTFAAACGVARCRGWLPGLGHVDGRGRRHLPLLGPQADYALSGRSAVRARTSRTPVASSHTIQAK